MRLTWATQRAERSHRQGVEDLVCLRRLSHDLTKKEDSEEALIRQIYWL